MSKTRQELQELVDEIRIASELSDEEIFDMILESEKFSEDELQILAEILGIA